MGVKLSKNEISKKLKLLDFNPTWKNNTLEASVPSYRAEDIYIPEDIIEEIARIYGYHNLPSTLMTGKLPHPNLDFHFDVEIKIKSTLKGLGGNETLSYSLVDKKMAGKTALKLKNPLGKDTEYLRTSLRPSLVKAAKNNKGNSEKYHLFEMANTYIPVSKELPKEELTLAGIFEGHDFLEAKSVIQTLLSALNIDYKIKISDTKKYKANKKILFNSGKEVLGFLGELKNGYIYYEFKVEGLIKYYKKTKSYTEIPKYPAQVEDITFKIPEGTFVGEVYDSILKSHKLIKKAELIDQYKRSFTFRIWYQSKKNSLTDKEVEATRKTIIDKIVSKYQLELPLK